VTLTCHIRGRLSK